MAAHALRAQAGGRRLVTDRTTTFVGRFRCGQGAWHVSTGSAEVAAAVRRLFGERSPIQSGGASDQLELLPRSSSLPVVISGPESIRAGLLTAAPRFDPKPGVRVVFRLTDAYDLGGFRLPVRPSASSPRRRLSSPPATVPRCRTAAPPSRSSAPGAKSAGPQPEPGRTRGGAPTSPGEGALSPVRRRQPSSSLGVSSCPVFFSAAARRMCPSSPKWTDRRDVSSFLPPRRAGATST